MTASALLFISRKAADASGGTSPGGSLRRLPGRKAECFGMSPAVVLGQGIAEAAGPVGHGAAANLAAGERQLGNGDREAAGR